MARNYPFPWQIHYTLGTQAAFHKQTWGINVSNSPDVGDNFADVMVARKGDTEQSLTDFLLDFQEVVEPFLKPATTISGIELWKYPPESYDGTFYGGTTLSMSHGDGGHYAPNTYRIYSFRTAEGGIMYHRYFDFDSWGNGQLLYSELDTYEKDYVDFVTSNQTAFIGLDGSYPVSFLRASSGENEALWKRRFRRAYIPS